MANMTCWFCEKNISESSHAIRIKFERLNYADRIAQAKGEMPDRLRKTLTIGRCETCYLAHKRYNWISLFAIIPGGVLAYSLFLLFRKAETGLIFTMMACALVGFGIVLFLRRAYLKKRGIKALVEMEMKNDDIREILANGWYRV